jgi:hypothetical protein
MAVKRLVEISVGLIEAHLQANITTALGALEVQRNDTLVVLESPKDWFRYAPEKGYRMPAIYTICNVMRMMNDRGANHINAQMEIVVSALLGGTTLDELVTKTWRYQAVLQGLLHEQSLTTGDGAVKIVCKVEEMHFSPELTDTIDRDEKQNVFRKEVSLVLNVEHYESF